ncbi:MAG: hypothetical protein KJ670_13510 [Alphaproteobacteria bacterium]|nr:hypothetical protein [Rhizobiaceae bacterium]MBU3959382.1 hypothetical protein [Alphaproteobacteria bacterium]MBU4049477.1 hypothetical protein [Alphaproteobacteria bacterium]MBU4089725.1 hypothetical protein [Alphaproteobacteria bacterium]MBU4154784.1 hypothetical protein [Alphaproteobacteria bacterium]
MPKVAVVLCIIVAAFASVFMVPVAAKAASELELLFRSNEEAMKSYNECVSLYQLADTKKFETSEKDKLTTCLATFGEYILKHPNYLASQPRMDHLMERYDLFYKDGMVKG